MQGGVGDDRVCVEGVYVYLMGCVQVLPIVCCVVVWCCWSCVGGWGGVVTRIREGVWIEGVVHDIIGVLVMVCVMSVWGAWGCDGVCAGGSW